MAAFIDHPVVEWSDVRRRRPADHRRDSGRRLARARRHFRLRAGLALVLKTSMWAKRRYVRFKRWQPKAGRWADWALRRRAPSGARRSARREEGAARRPPTSAETSDPRLRQLTLRAPLHYRRARQRLPQRRPFFFDLRHER
jgi:hypothetical protein